MKKGLNGVDNIDFDNLPILLIKESRYSIRTKSFVMT